MQTLRSLGCRNCYNDFHYSIQLTGHLWCVRNVVMDQFAPDGSEGRQVIVWIVHIFVHGQRNVSGAGQESFVRRLTRNANTCWFSFETLYVNYVA